MATDYPIDGKIGIDITAVYESASANIAVPWPASPEDTVRTNNDGEYMFARAQSDVAQYDLVFFATYGDSASQTPTVRAAPASVALLANGGAGAAGPML